MSTIFQKITHYPTLEAAFERVRENAGCRGSDGVTINRFAYHLERNLRDLSNSLHKQSYHPMRIETSSRGGIETVTFCFSKVTVFCLLSELRPYSEVQLRRLSYGNLQKQKVTVCLKKQSF